MTESETEAETLERLEAALLRIAHLARPPSHPPQPGSDANIDREALIRSLDLLIARLRAGLNPANGNPQSPE
jgi:hypothetical protein